MHQCWPTLLGVTCYFRLHTCCRSDLLPEVYTRCDNAAFANFVAAISRTNSNWFEFVRLIAATKFCRSDNDFHEINRVTQGDLLRRLVPATCRSDLSPSVSRPLATTTTAATVTRTLSLNVNSRCCNRFATIPSILT